MVEATVEETAEELAEVERGDEAIHADQKRSKSTSPPDATASTSVQYPNLF